MKRLVGVCIVTLFCTFLSTSMTAGDAVGTDTDIVTALDISDSMDPQLLRLAIEGMARAVRAPEVLRAIQCGHSRRIGFTMFAWSHGGSYPELVSWTTIGSEADALYVSSEITHWLRIADEAEGRRQNRPHHAGRLTDTSAAIDHAAELLLTAPYPTKRAVVNIIGNGEDNVGEGPEHARDDLILRGATINGVVLGTETAVLNYYRRHVVGGPGAFSLFSNDPGTIVDLFERKLRYDLVTTSRFDQQLAAR